MQNYTHERWAAIPGYEGYYEVSDRGNVRSHDRYVDCHGQRNFVRGQDIRSHANPKGYRVLTLCKMGKKKSLLVHAIVLQAFVSERPNKMVGCHNDGNPANNMLSNLRWDTQSNNMNDAVAHGTHSEAKKTHCAHGHEYTPANTWYSTYAPNKRKCRECLHLANLRRSAYRVQWARNKRAKHIGVKPN